MGVLVRQPQASRIGRPTIIVPFFGDQQFWGDIVARAGAGPAPIPYKRLNVQNLSDAIEKALEASTLEKGTGDRNGHAGRDWSATWGV